MTTTQKDLEDIRAVANGYITMVISDITLYQHEAKNAKAFSPELGRQVKANCAKRVQATLANLNKTIERFNTTALSVFDQPSTKEADHGST